MGQLLPFRIEVVSSSLKLVTDQTFGLAELLLCGSAQMTELFSAEDRTFFILHSMPMASFHILFLLKDPKMDLDIV